MCLGGEVQNGRWTMLLEQLTNGVRIGDIDLRKDVSRIVECSPERSGVTGICQLVDVHDSPVGGINQMSNECRPDKARATRNQHSTRCHRENRGSRSSGTSFSSSPS